MSLSTASVSQLSTRHSRACNFISDTPEEVLRDTVCRNEHYDAYMKNYFPKRYHYANNKRISPIVIDVEEEWLVGR